MREKGAPPDARIARLATRQHGVVSIEQLHEAGLSDAAVSRRVAGGRLHRIHRGVYAVGHYRVGIEGLWMAAVLAIGRGAVLSHLSAAALWGLLRPAGGSVDISIPTRSGRRKRKGIRLHRCTDLSSRDLSRRKGIPVTTPARTIADLKRALPSGQYHRAIRQADVLGLATGLSAPPVPTRSELEDRFLALCRRHGVPEPEVNVRIGALTVDFLWRGQRLVVETDGYRYHRGESAFEHDHDRDLRLRQLGYDVLRLSYRQVTREAQTVAALIRRELAGGHSSTEP